MSEGVHPTQDHHLSHLSLANRNPSVYLPGLCPYPSLYPYLVHRLFLSNRPIQVSPVHLVVVVHSHVHTDSYHNPVHQIDHGSRKGLRGLQGKAADEEVAARTDGTGVVDVGEMVVVKVPVQAVDVGQCLVGTVGTPQ